MSRPGADITSACATTREQDKGIRANHDYKNNAPKGRNGNNKWHAQFRHRQTLWFLSSHVLTIHYRRESTPGQTISFSPPLFLFFFLTQKNITNTNLKNKRERHKKSLHDTTIPILVSPIRLIQPRASCYARSGFSHQQTRFYRLFLGLSHPRKLQNKVHIKQPFQLRLAPVRLRVVGPV